MRRGQTFAAARETLARSRLVLIEARLIMAQIDEMLTRRVKENVTR